MRKKIRTLYELVSTCYEYISPNIINEQFQRISNSAKPKTPFSTPQILGKNTHGIEFSDLFCGAGGLSLGFEMEGAVCKLAIDHDESAIETYAVNRSEDSTVLCQSILDFLNDDTKVIPQTPLLIGGPPCQGFSLANQQQKENDPRNLLYAAFLEYASRSNAKVLVMENVPGILKNWTDIESDLTSRGYSSHIFDMEASNFGVPQKRHRVFIVGVSKAHIKCTDKFFDDIHKNLQNQKNTSKTFNIADALFGLPSVKAKNIKNATYLENEDFGFTIAPPIHAKNSYTKAINAEFPDGFLFNHRTKYNNPRDIELFASLSQGEDTTCEKFAALDPYKHRNHIFKDKFYRLSENLLSKTITAHMYYDCHMYIHPHENRGLTPREAARIQGFPDQYLFLGKPNEWYRQIGNAVSPIVGKCLARAILPAMHKHLGIDT